MARDYRDLTAAQMAARLERRMRRTGEHLTAVCEAWEWSYDLVYQRLEAAGELPRVMAAKYAGREAAR